MSTTSASIALIEGGKGGRTPRLGLCGDRVENLLFSREERKKKREKRVFFYLSRQHATPNRGGEKEKKRGSIGRSKSIDFTPVVGHQVRRKREKGKQIEFVSCYFSFPAGDEGEGGRTSRYGRMDAKSAQVFGVLSC